MQLRLFREYSKLLDYSEICLHKSYNNWRALYYKAFYYAVAIDNYTKSLEILEQMQLEQPELCEALSLKLYVLNFIKIEENQDLADKIILLNNIVFYRLGLHFYDLDEIQKSLHYTNKSLEFCPNKLSTLVLCALLQKDKKSEVSKLFSQAEKLYPRNSFFSTNPNYSAQYFMAEIYSSELNQKEKAIDTFKKCIKVNPNDTFYFHLLRECASLQRNLKKIFKQQNNIQKNLIKNCICIIKGIEYDQEHYNQSLQYIEEVLEIDPKDIFSLNLYGCYFKEEKKIQRRPNYTLKKSMNQRRNIKLFYLIQEVLKKIKKNNKNITKHQLKKNLITKVKQSDLFKSILIKKITQKQGNSFKNSSKDILITVMVSINSVIQKKNKKIISLQLNYQSAIIQYQNSLKINQQKTVCLLKIGFCYKSMEMYDKANQYFNKYNDKEKDSAADTIILE